MLSGYPPAMVELTVAGLELDPEHGQALLMLREQSDPHRLLPIWIGPAEADAIEQAGDGIASARPSTHRLLHDVIDHLGHRVERVTIVRVLDHQVHAELLLDTGSMVSARAGDAVALGVRNGLSIHGTEEVLAQAGIAEGRILRIDISEEELSGIPTDQAGEPLVDEFRRFLGEVRADDFDR